MNWLDTAIEVAKSQQSAVLITVADVKGSSPREAGAKMLVLTDSTIGTIGGGALELDAVLTARLGIEQQTTGAILKDYPLGPTLEQCCGGFVQLMFEAIDQSSLNWLIQWQEVLTNNKACLFKTTVGESAKHITSEQDIKTSSTVLADNTLFEYVIDDRQPLWLFGAGHVTQALVETLRHLDYAITVVDQRDEFLKELAHKNINTRQNDVSCREVGHAPSGAMILVMTHSHAQDFDICHKALLRDDLSFIGLIGSATKRARFIKRLREKGLSETVISNLTCPIGIGNINDKRPEAIAVSVAAQLLSLQSQIAVKAIHINQVSIK